MLESRYQAKLIKRIERMFPGCMVLKNNPEHIQGIPDLLVLHGERWAGLEVKAALDSEHQPNQDYYVGMMDGMSFAAFICPETEEEVLHALQQALISGGSARIS